MSGLGDVASPAGPVFWADLDLGALSEQLYGRLCDALQLHGVTRRDVAIEDHSITDTKVSMHQHYLFAIVDTLVPAAPDAQLSDLSGIPGMVRG